MELLRAALVIVMLGTAVIPDLRHRRVANLHWMPYVIIAAVLFLADATRWQDYTPSWIFSAISSALVYALWQLKLFGGADAKALIVVAWLWPGVPSLVNGELLPVVDILVNASVMTMLIPIGFLVYNLARGQLAFPALLFGIPMEREAAAAKAVWPLQDVVEDRVVWRLRARVGGSDAWPRLRAHKVASVWVTPQIPFIVPLALGAVIAAVYGNLLVRLTLAYTL